MAAPKKKPVTRRRTVKENEYTKLDEYCIWLHEYHKALRRAGFSNDNALWIMTTKESYPDWVRNPNVNDILNHIDEEDED
jgi:hypothetical protein